MHNFNHIYRLQHFQEYPRFVISSHVSSNSQLSDTNKMQSYPKTLVSSFGKKHTMYYFNTVLENVLKGMH